MSFKLVSKCRSENQTANMTAIEIHVQILQLISSFHKNTWLFQINKIIDSHFVDMAFHIHDRFTLKNFVNSTRK